LGKNVTAWRAGWGRGFEWGGDSGWEGECKACVEGCVQVCSGGWV
jgi:hypothetical protein